MIPFRQNKCLATFVAMFFLWSSIFYGYSQTLADALDTTNLVWVTQGWSTQTTNTVDTADAAVGGPNAWIEVTVPGAGYISFWWRGGCNESFYVDGGRLAGAPLDWQRATYRVPASVRSDKTAILRWENGYCNYGDYPLFLDQVTFTPDPPPQPTNPSVAVPPKILTQPLSQTGLEGSTIFLSVVASGTPPLFYNWHHNGVPNSAPNSALINFSPAQSGNAGVWTVTVTNSAGAVSSEPVTVSVVDTEPLPKSLEAEEFAWETGGAGGWFGQAAVYHTNGDAGQSGLITNSQVSWMKTSVLGPGRVSFWWKVSSETNYDQLAAYVDSNAVSHISGEVDWREEIVLVPQGNHEVRWQYAKDDTLSAGKDHGWVDEVRYVRTIPPEVALSADYPSIGVGGQVMLSLTVAPLTPADSFLWFRNQQLWETTNGQKQIILTNVTCSDNSEWFVVASNGFGMSTSAPVYLTVYQATFPAFLDHLEPATNTVNVGSDFIVSINANVDPRCPDTFADWYKGGEHVGQGLTLALTNVTSSDSGVYTLVVSVNGYDTIRSEPITLKVVAPLAAASPVKVQDTFMLSCQAVQGNAYWVEYTTNLANPTWRFLTGVTNTNGAISFKDPNAVDRMRFYRVVSAP